MLNLNDIYFQQKKIIKNIKSIKIYNKNYRFIFLKAVSKIDKKKLEIAFGEFGLRLKSFVDSIDLNHPDLANIFHGHLVCSKDESFAGLAHQLLKIITFAHQNNVSDKIILNIRQLLFCHSVFRKLDISINSPTKNQIHVRFVDDKDIRSSIRKTKKTQKINYHDCKINYFSSINDFSTFIRKIDIEKPNNNQKNVKFLQRRFNKLGLTCIEKNIDKKLKSLDANLYFGFKPIQISEALSILFRMNKTDTNLSKSSTVYILHEVYDWASKETKKIINYIDSYPDIGGRCLFDHLRVVMVSPKVHKIDGKFTFTDNNNNILKFDNEYQAQKAFDFYLFKERKIIGVLLGDRDGDNFFISYFI